MNDKTIINSELSTSRMMNGELSMVNKKNDSQFTTHNSPLKKGYKNTEIGVIPVEWEVKKLSSFANVSSGGTPNRDVSSYWNGSIPWITTSQIDFNIIKEANEFITEEGLNSSAAKLFKAGNLLMAMYGQGKTRGKIAILGIDATTNQACATILLNKGVLREYVFFNLSGRYDEIRNLSNTGGQENLSGDLIKKIQIPLPPLPEQTAIANVLSDTDSLIQALGNKIAKKQLIKKGAMQKLLSPKEDWEENVLPTVCWFQEGPGLRNWQFTKKGMKVINVTNLVNGYLNLDRTDRHISMQEFEKMYKHFEIDDKDIVMASSGNSYSKVAVVRKQDLRLLMNTSVIRFKPLNGLDYNYLLIFLKSNLFKDQIDLLITGGAQPNFGPAHLKQIKISLPSTKQEQTHIAQILSDMDSEIETLQKKLTKYKELKQGLMQNLLTGKIRLV